MQELSEGGEAGQYSPGVSAALTQIVPYSASLYTVFHSVFYNSVVVPLHAYAEALSHVGVGDLLLSLENNSRTGLCDKKTIILPIYIYKFLCRIL